MVIRFLVDNVKVGLELKRVNIFVGEEANIWLSLVFALIKIARREEKPFPFLFPEAFLHPTAQRDIANDMGRAYNEGKWVFVATYSPYILAQLNNLLLAKSLYKETREEEIRERYKGLWIDPEDVAVYEVEFGRVKNLIDEEGLIEAGAIDAVSDEIVKEMDWMLEVAYGGRESGEAGTPQGEGERRHPPIPADPSPTTKAGAPRLLKRR